MKGLLLKELLMLRKNFFAIAILAAVFSIFGIFSGEPVMLVIVSLFMSVWSVGLINVDEISKWKQYSIALPYGRRKIVSSKYLMILILNAVSIIYVVLSYLISAAIGKSTFSAGILCILMLISLIMGLAYPSFLLPLVYKMNTDKGRMVLMIINGIVSGTSAVLIQTLGFRWIIFGGLAEFLPYIIVAAVAVLYLLSWLLSVRIYEKKDL